MVLLHSLTLLLYSNASTATQRSTIPISIAHNIACGSSVVEDDHVTPWMCLPSILLFRLLHLSSFFVGGRHTASLPSRFSFFLNSRFASRYSGSDCVRGGRSRCQYRCDRTSTIALLETQGTFVSYLPRVGASTLASRSCFMCVITHSSVNSLLCSCSSPVRYVRSHFCLCVLLPFLFFSQPPAEVRFVWSGLLIDERCKVGSDWKGTKRMQNRAL